MVFMMNGIFDPSTPTEDTAEFYQKTVRGRNDLEIAEHRAEAAEYFLEQFGLDFRFNDVDGGVSFFGFMDARRNNYRAYTISGERVPSSGVLVDGGDWMFSVTDPNGVRLHGRYGGTEGLWVPVGTSGVFGEYVLHLTAGESARPTNRLSCVFSRSARSSPARMALFRSSVHCGIPSGAKACRCLRRSCRTAAFK